MNSQRFTIISFAALAALVVVGTFQNCGVVNRPAVEDQTMLSSLSGYVHTGNETSCSSCHDKDRPAENLKLPFNAVAQLNQSLTQYVHGVNYDGKSDCIACHANNPSSFGITWSGAAYSHKDGAGRLVSSCTTCHQAPKATTTSNPSLSFDHAGNKQECIACHTSVGQSWKISGGGNYVHTGTEKNCMSCHESDRPGETMGLPINATAALNQSLTRFFHTQTFGGKGDCVSCHTEVKANIGATWSGGFYDHTVVGGGKVATCIACHAAPRGSPTSNPPVAFNHANNTQDCLACHSAAGISWKTTSGHTHMATDSCISCHTSDRPSASMVVPMNKVPKKNLFVHAANYVEAVDCKKCHLKQMANLGVSWAGAGFDHKTTAGALVGTCTPCHTTGVDRPAATTRLPATATNRTNVYFHASAYFGTADCASCHLAVTANIGVNWQGGLYNHRDAAGAAITSGCLNCHGDQMPSATTAVPSTLRDSFVHSATYVGNGDCFGCHVTKSTNSKLSSAWAGAKWSRRTTFHKTATGGSITTCLPCHSNRDHNKGKECYQCHKRPGSWDN